MRLYSTKPPRHPCIGRSQLRVNCSRCASRMARCRNRQRRNSVTRSGRQSSARSNVVQEQARDELAIVVNQLGAGTTTCLVARSLWERGSNSLPSAVGGSTTLDQRIKPVRRQSAANNETEFGSTPPPTSRPPAPSHRYAIARFTARHAGSIRPDLGSVIGTCGIGPTDSGCVPSSMRVGVCRVRMSSRWMAVSISGG